MIARLAAHELFRARQLELDVEIADVRFGDAAMFRQEHLDELMQHDESLVSPVLHI